MGEPLLTVRHLCKSFPIYSNGLLRKCIGQVKAVEDLSFDLHDGETLGLVGESGCGKSTAVRTILRAINPTSGQVLFRTADGIVDLARISGKKMRTIRQEIQMIFQDPFSSLNPRMTISEIVGEPLIIHKISAGQDLRDRIISMLRLVGLGPDVLDRYPHEFSGGQRQRIGIARALILQPNLVIADEAVSALDVSVQAQVINLLMDLQEQFGLTLIFVSHDLAVVRHICTHIAVMYAGRVVEIAPTQDLFENPKHPYTKALLEAVPSADPDAKVKSLLDGEVADLARLPKGCSFYPRCKLKSARCKDERPDLLTYSNRCSVACFYAEVKSIVTISN